jgi:multidrug efflux pump
MLVMDQHFDHHDGHGIVALAGIAVNNNIVLTDTYQEYEKYMPRPKRSRVPQKTAFALCC